MEKMPNRKAILSTAARHEPSMCIVAPTGITTLLISAGTPILAAACRFSGRVAIELPVASDVTAGGIMLLQNFFTPGPRPAINA